MTVSGECCVIGVLSNATHISTTLEFIQFTDSRRFPQECKDVTDTRPTTEILTANVSARWLEADEKLVDDRSRVRALRFRVGRDASRVRIELLCWTLFTGHAEPVICIG